ncbi:MAG: hypothetical protein HYT12_02870 [Candidatus Liptonbacteria bacterium]|nr:hypothetical protein [Candidatus Liptonbacteria bacterium]
MAVIERKVTYIVQYSYPACRDDGDPDGFHDIFWLKSSIKVDALNDQEAQLASMGNESHREEVCYHGRRANPSAIIKIVEELTKDGWERRTESEVPLPRLEQCPCGKKYWPIKGERKCHELVPVC